MRFFTVLTAVALVMSACGTPTGEFEAENGVGTRANAPKQIVFHKVVEVAEGVTIPAAEGEFSFELYEMNKKGQIALVGDDNPYTTDANGDVVVPFTDFKGQGDYFFREVFETPEEAAKWEPLADLHFTLQPGSGAQWVDYGEVDFGQECPTIVNIPIVEVPGELSRVGRVNLTNNADEVLKVNGDHRTFCYAILNREILEGDGVVELDMVGENANHPDLGDAYVSVVDGKIVITVEGELRKFEWMIYEGVWNNNGKNELTSEPLDFPAGDEDVCIFVRAEYWK